MFFRTAAPTSQVFRAMLNLNGIISAGALTGYEMWNTLALSWTVFSSQISHIAKIL